MGRFENNPFIL